MSKLKGLTSRTERLERGTKGGECDGCTRAALEQLTAWIAAEKARSASEDPIPNIPSPCPECGNPYPQVPLRVVREMLKYAEEMESAEEQQAVDSVPAPKVKTSREENEHH